jgi:hypothetical protein
VQPSAYSSEFNICAVATGAQPNCINEVRYERERIADEAVVGPAEDRRFFLLVTDTIIFESIMPAGCWIAPETPTAMYGCGATILRVWPTLWHIARVDHCARRAKCSAELVGSLQ